MLFKRTLKEFKEYRQSVLLQFKHFVFILVNKTTVFSHTKRVKRTHSHLRNTKALNKNSSYLN